MQSGIFRNSLLQLAVLATHARNKMLTLVGALSWGFCQNLWRKRTSEIIRNAWPLENDCGWLSEKDTLTVAGLLTSVLTSLFTSHPVATSNGGMVWLLTWALRGRMASTQNICSSATFWQL